MNFLAEYQNTRRNEEIQVVVAEERPPALEDRETRPYVVRDLSWELASYLETLDS